MGRPDGGGALAPQETAAHEEERRKELQAQEQQKKLFEGLKFFLNREVPREALAFIVRWEGPQHWPCHSPAGPPAQGSLGAPRNFGVVSGPTEGCVGFNGNGAGKCAAYPGRTGSAHGRAAGITFSPAEGRRSPLASGGVLGWGGDSCVLGG